jgi:hypothetical protein
MVHHTRDEGPNEGILDHILYVIVLPARGSGEFTPFQGFSFNSFDLIEPIIRICSLPATIDELFIPRRAAIARRTTGFSGYAVAAIELEFVTQFMGGLPFTCFISTESTGHEVDRHVQACGRNRWLHLTLDPAARSVRSLSRFSRRQMYNWARTLARQIAAEGHVDIRGHEPRVRPFASWKKIRLHLHGRQHNITLPSETALTSVGFSLAKAKPIVAATDDVYATALDEVAREVERIRGKATARLRPMIPGTPSLIVAVPSVFRQLSPRIVPPDAPRPVRRAVRNVLHQQQYTAMRTEGSEIKTFLENDEAKNIVWTRAMELKTYTAVLSISAASLCAPVLRCPPQVDRVRELLLRLDGLSRAGRLNNLRLNALARQVGHSLRQAIPNALHKGIERHLDGGIKFIGDTPLELLPIGDLPLALRATTSRMPTLPGTLMSRQCLLRTTMLLKPRDFARVLIVRAFDDADPLRDLVTTSIRAFHDDDAPIEYVVADVQTTDEFVSAFNDFDGTVAIFDGHGSHTRASKQGTLRIGTVSFNPFELYGQIRVPPIVLLSACETHPLEGIESSVASAFLFMGAKSVLGTTLPISGVNAAILVARFMHRFSGLLPHINNIMPWSQVVAGMLRMSYVTDVLRGLAVDYPITENIHKTVHTEANIMINSFRPDWFDRFMMSISRALNVPEPQLRDSWLRSTYFTDTMRYVHLGQPEHIFVVPQTLVDENERQKPKK